MLVHEEMGDFLLSRVLAPSSIQAPDCVPCSPRRKSALPAGDGSWVHHPVRKEVIVTGFWSFFLNFPQVYSPAEKALLFK